MKEKYTLDRTEGEIAVCISRRDGRVIELPAAPLLAAGVTEGGIFSAEINETEFTDIEYLEQETEKAKGDARKRLLELFNRRKDNEE